MNSSLMRADGWLFPQAPPERLATLRILTGLFAVIYLAVRLPAFLVLADAQPSRFEPVGVLAFLDEPLAGPIVFGLVFAALGLGLAYIVGAWFRVSGPAFALVLLVLSTYRSSWGQILWIENLMVWHVLIVGFARSADAITLIGRPAIVAPAAKYGAPVRLAALVTVGTYLLAVIAKLRLSGDQWMFGDSLRNHVAYSAVRVDLLGGPASPFGRWLVAFDWLFPPMAVAAVILDWRHPWPCSAGDGLGGVSVAHARRAPRPRRFRTHCSSWPLLRSIDSNACGRDDHRPSPIHKAQRSAEAGWLGSLRSATVVRRPPRRARAHIRNRNRIMAIVTITNFPSRRTSPT
jgi:hypothetical protein